MTLNELAAEIHETAVVNGFHDNPRRLPEILMLASSELGEAFDAWRDWPELLVNWASDKPEGWAVEIVDCIIVCLDILATNNVDIDEITKKKMEYNCTRPRLHGRHI